MPSVNYAGCRRQAHYAKLCYGECHYAEYRGALFTAFSNLIFNGLKLNYHLSTISLKIKVTVLLNHLP
jgi:hypothetical protein